MKQVADEVWHLDTIPLPNAVNAYLVGDVLVDSGGRRSARRILRQLDGRTVTAHAITHAHSDHLGSSHELCSRLGVPYWVPERDVAAAENTSLIRERQPDHPVARFYVALFNGPGHTADRVLRQGDEVAGFRVIDTPGHSPGHISFWREGDRTLILGDVLNNMDVLTGLPGLRLPKHYLTPDPAENRRSAERLGALEPNLVLFGHGAPLRDPRKFQDFIRSL